MTGVRGADMSSTSCTSCSVMPLGFCLFLPGRLPRPAVIRVRPLWRLGFLPQSRVELVERALAGAQLALAERIERRLDRVEMRMQVARLFLHIEQAGDDLALGGVVLKEAHRRGAVMHIVIGGELAQRDLGAVMLLDHLDGAGLV